MFMCNSEIDLYYLKILRLIIKMYDINIYFIKIYNILLTFYTQ